MQASLPGCVILIGDSMLCLVTQPWEPCGGPARGWELDEVDGVSRWMSPPRARRGSDLLANSYV
jgi:hypothetical protein